MRSVSITKGGLGRLGHGLFPRSARTASGVALVLLCLPAPDRVRLGREPSRTSQRVAFCQGPSSENADGDLVEIEFRQGSKVVARASGSVGTAFTVEVPPGAVQIYVDGVQKGSVDEGVPHGRPYHSPGPDDVTYIADQGCPESAPLPPPSED